MKKVNWSRVLALVGFAIALVATVIGGQSRMALAQNAAGDCWKVDPLNGKQVAVAFVAGPNMTDCTLPNQACRTVGNCTLEPPLAQWWRCTASIKVGECTTPAKPGNCSPPNTPVCPERLNCAVGDFYNNLVNCNAGGNAGKIASSGIAFGPNKCK